MVKKSRNIILIIIVITLMIAGSIYILAQRKGISMIDGKVIADEEITSMGLDYLFVGASGHEDKGNGIFSHWGYSYYLFSSENVIEIEVYTNGETTSEYHDLDNETKPLISNFEIGDWSLDSTDAYDVSSSNDIIGTFLSKYNTNIDIMQLTHPDMVLSSVKINTTVWFIHYNANTFGDNPKSAEIYIDANTGEVLYVEADS